MVKMIDAQSHVRGESRFIDDFPLLDGTLFAAPLLAPSVGEIQSIDARKALALEGVHSILFASDIPGENQVGGIIPDEPLLAEGQTHFIGQPVALVLAVSRDIAYQARRAIELNIRKTEVITSAEEADRRERYLFPPRHLEMGKPDQAWDQCEYVIEGKAESGFQEHLYLETQGSICIPQERGHLRVISSTQSPTGVQRSIARVLGLSMHLIEVEVLRLGGAFGGKEDQAAPWASLAALGSFTSHRPVKCVLERADDMIATGKRHPYTSTYRLGLSKELKMIAYEVTFLQNGGACADLSPAILERTICHATGSYFIPNVRITAKSCKTDIPPNTAFRGFGGPQGLFVIEAAIAHAARIIGCRPHAIQQTNLLNEGDELPFGQRVEACKAQTCWDQAVDRFQLDLWEERMDSFNRKNVLKKMGLAMMPICFGISFNKSSMNQAGALVHIYQDGSVAISTAAVEMGQGVNTKMVHVASTVLGVSPERVRVEPTNTTRVANTSPTAASSAADMNGKATEKACLILKSRLLTHAAKEKELDFADLELKKDALFSSGKATGWTWDHLIRSAFDHRVDLTEHGYYKTPGIYYDLAKGKGKPFAYHVYGSALLVATVDILRGSYEVERVLIMHDFGKSLNPEIDRGQVEGALAQGIGWMTLEELAYSKEGRLLAHNLSNYKVPDLHAMPRHVETYFLETEGNEKAVFKSKAIGEPPFLYGIGAFYAILDAMQAYRNVDFAKLKAPMTPERVLMTCHGE